MFASWCGEASPWLVWMLPTAGKKLLGSPNAEACSPCSADRCSVWLFELISMLGKAVDEGDCQS